MAKSKYRSRLEYNKYMVDWNFKNRYRLWIQKKQRYNFVMELMDLIRWERGCECCGIKNPNMLNFHHLDQSLKRKNLSLMFNFSVETVMLEIEKCQVLCTIHHLEYNGKHCKRRRLNKLLIDNIRMYNSCEICGENYYRALQFHHKKPEEKEFGVGSGIYNRTMEEIWSEIQKCVLLCGNCHFAHQAVNGRSLNDYFDGY